MWVVRQTYPGGTHLEPQTFMILQVAPDAQMRALELDAVTIKNVRVAFLRAKSYPFQRTTAV
jgi:hypothetical protein